MTRIIKPLHLPEVTAYLLTGVAVGPYLLGSLGIALFPQAGVALGMCVTASTLEGDGEIIRNIVLFAIFVYEVFGPMLTKNALKRAGDIVGKSDMVKHRREDVLSGKHETWTEEET